MLISNTKLYEAVNALTFGEGDVRKRVVMACQLMQKMSRNEVNMEIRKKIDIVLQKASPNKPIRDFNGNVINGYDKFEVSAKNKKNATYVKLAKEIYSIYWDELN